MKNQKWFDELAKNLATSNLSRGQVLKSFAAGMLMATPVGALWNRTASAATCPSCGKCTIVNIDTAAGTAKQAECAGALECTANALCKQANENTRYRKLETYLKNKGFKTASAPKAMVLREDGQLVRKVLGTYYTNSARGLNAMFTYARQASGKTAVRAIVGKGNVVKYALVFNKDGKIIKVLPPEVQPPTGVTYDLLGDFSSTANPSGAWSYGYRTSGGSGFTLYTKHDNPVAGIDRWHPVGATEPMVAYNGTGQTLRYGTISHPPDVLNVHPGPAGERSVVRWTAPESSTVQIEGRFEGLDTDTSVGGTTTDVTILHNSTATLFSANINGFGAKAPFSISRSVAAGDTIDFSVGIGSNNTHANDSTGLSATITASAPTFSAAESTSPASETTGASYDAATTFSAARFNAESCKLKCGMQCTAGSTLSCWLAGALICSPGTITGPGYVACVAIMAIGCDQLTDLGCDKYCEEEACRCPYGFVTCGDLCMGPCEICTNTGQIEPKDCNGPCERCNRSTNRCEGCPPGKECVLNECVDTNCGPDRIVCPPEKPKCCGKGDEGRCVNLQTSERHCGGCFTECPECKICESGRCKCPPGTIPDGQGGCIGDSGCES